MFTINKEEKIHYTLRIASALCFIGHGIFGVITKPVWCNYFGVFGINPPFAYQLMPVLGFVDILCGILILIYPVRAVIFWLVIWGFVTALLRPLSGEPVAEFLERFGNFGAPLALLIISEGISGNFKKWISPLKIKKNNSDKTWSQLIMVLRITVFILFLGHGLLNIIGKKSLVAEYQMFGFDSPAETAVIIGFAEIAIALFVLIRPFRQLLFVLLLWKIFSELFYPKYELFELIERSGSYGVILALWFALESTSVLNSVNEKFRYYTNSIYLTFKKS